MIRTYYFELANPDNDFYCTMGKGSSDTPSGENADAQTWTKLLFHQCSHCPLSAEETAYCPVALDMAIPVEHFSRYASCERVTLHAIMDSKRHSIVTDLQSALAYVYPFIMATSACPYAGLLRPAEAFRKVFPDICDMFFHAFSCDLIPSHFRKDGVRPLSGPCPNLGDHVSANPLILAFRGLLDRVQTASESDANVNAISRDIRWFSHLLNPRETVFGHLRQFFTLC